MLFAHLKRILRLGRLRLRGPNGADEFLLAAPAQNLRKPGEAHSAPGTHIRHMRWEPGICLADIATNPKCWHQNSGFFNKINVKRTFQIQTAFAIVGGCARTASARLAPAQRQASRLGRAIAPVPRHLPL